MTDQLSQQLDEALAEIERLKRTISDLKDALADQAFVAAEANAAAEEARAERRTLQFSSACSQLNGENEPKT